MSFMLCVSQQECDLHHRRWGRRWFPSSFESPCQSSVRLNRWIRVYELAWHAWWTPNLPAVSSHSLLLLLAQQISKRSNWYTRGKQIKYIKVNARPTQSSSLKYMKRTFSLYGFWIWWELYLGEYSASYQNVICASPSAPLLCMGFPYIRFSR